MPPRFAPCRRLAATLLGLLAACPQCSFAWGDRGHEIIGIIAESYLDKPVLARVHTLLAGDASGLTATTGVADEATWADKFRDSDRATTGTRYRQTRAWHYINIEVDAGAFDAQMNAACFGHPTVAAGVGASAGPGGDCILDKIGQFRRELREAGTTPDERRLALQFLLHFVGDLHQPLHAADRHDKGGNDLLVQDASAPPGSLHHYWDSVFVERLGEDPKLVSRKLTAGLTRTERRLMSAGTPADWARESFQVARRHAYGLLPEPELPLGDAYDRDAERAVALQLRRAGLRLARLLNQALSP